MTPTLTVYSASAGSGKTFTLTAYYIAQLMKNPDPEGFKHLLAVTFTIKATAEMKDRILGTLYNLSRLKAGAASREMQSYLEAISRFDKGRAYTEAETATVVERAGRCLEAILKNYDRFRVVTIDSFFQSVMRGVARELGLPANMRTEVSHDAVRRQAVERLMECLTPGTPHYSPSLSEQVWRFVKSRIDEDQKWSVRKLLYDFSEELYVEAFAQHRAAIARQLEDSACLGGMIEELKQTVASCDQQRDQMVEVLKGFISGKGIQERCDLNGNKRNWLLGAIGKMAAWDKKPFSPSMAGYTAQDMMKASAHADADIEQLVDLKNSAVAAYPSLLALRTGALMARKNLHQLGLLDAIGAFVKAINEEQGQFIVADTTQLIAGLLEGEGDASFVFEKIGPMLNQVMIDEFQDTSRQQWGNFRPLFEEILSGGGNDQGSHECLIVGDVKQSLYRWRNGSWEVLHHLPRDPQMQPFVDPRSLDTNYRSAREIVDFNNALFPRLAQRLDQLNGLDPRDAGYVSLEQVYQGVEQKSNDPGGEGYVYVRLYESEGKSTNRYRRDEATGAYADMRDQMWVLHEQGVAWGDMVILVRAKTRTPDIIQGFARDGRFRGVKVVSCAAFMLQSSWAVRLVVEVLRYLANPHDKVAQAYCEYFRRQGVKVNLDTFQALKDRPLQELNHSLIAAMQLGQYTDQGNYLCAYMDQVNQYVQSNPADIGAFLQSWDQRLCKVDVTNTSADAIRIVTYHVSKGLDFEHVFIPDDYYICNFKSGNRYWVATQDKGHPFDTLPVLPIDFSASGAAQSCFARERQVEIMQQNMDAINLEYVAFTRAKKSLYVWGTEQGNINSTINTEMMALVGQALQDTPLPHHMEHRDHSRIYTFGSAQRRLSKKPPTPKSPLEPLFLDEAPCRMRQGHYAPLYRQSTEAVRLLSGEEEGRAMAEGTHMHCVLARVIEADDFGKALETYCSEVKLSQEEKDELRAYFDQGLRLPMLREEWFGGKYRVSNEQTLILPAVDPVLGTNMPRPDRVMVDEEGRRVMVVDYKHTFGKGVMQRPQQHDRYLSQVRTYMGVLRQIYAEHQVEGYIWYLKDSVIETVTP